MIPKKKELKLIKIYMYICDLYDSELKYYCQRYSNNSNPVFTDQEIMTIYLFAGHCQKYLLVKDIHTFASEYLSSWFPYLPSYQTFNLRLNRLSEAFKILNQRLISSFIPKNYFGVNSLLNNSAWPAQRTGTIGGRAGDYSLRWENDKFAFDGDKFRSNAIEFGYKNWMIGTNVYTTDPNINGKENYDTNSNGSKIFNNKYNTYKEGKQLSSPLYIGYKHKNGAVTRIGYNHRAIGDMVQNGFHHLPFIASPNFKRGTHHNSFYYQVGRYKPNSMY
ncbi:hypothetical protein M2132_000390 [Dysgonomonas sp. PH5-45]|uniref:polymorphic toxin type 23 domain-containing protein n=1 Tax=unclassified Dysgonomonas TaxID=2630389 RepID=UPI0024738EC9|nr:MULTISPECIES: polymorphic toxin type 23 domain-containing protein [unclassified Dysgonomonas]MDH6354068.1 hypothetical protein [Dysgonomonas sp. PH5-45]MDH6387081.1 hypothetical protein [Dysgonomonas sp. PH5-37]